MKQFKEINPLTVAQDPNLIATVPDDEETTKNFYFLLVDDYIILATAKYFTDKLDGESEWLHYQIEFPKYGLRWFLDTLEGKFFKTEAEGGLPKGTFNDEGLVDGERLKLRRAFNADGNGGGGYAFITLDRKEPESVWSKSYTFTDSLLFEHGMIDTMKLIAKKIDLGQL
ncbi:MULTISPECIES: hypothetical protein [Vibrio]|jgi:hypothetical protein|uniref:Uncharacterized protein n=2 Tax=Vibrio harveyi group TaxID=717610 RepID=A0A7Y4F1Q6_VIBAL|nr:MULTISPECIES: hypothetical protein [Vibrio]MDW1972625.1 hypothetical protein [Vibrio sp. 945]OJI53862.1 hypothetical protein VFL11327_04419 [Vibrio fluvialis]AIV05883.1 hypothetical protein LA59_10530 [Vibrio harveyi]AVF65869.1 hypothetical protein AL541_16575 [Vibrio alginolyticus]EGQ9113248.1 hypothetical protein [Vibrio alginolyticus]